MLESSRRYYLYDKPVDMRKGFWGLSKIVMGQMCHSVKNGDGYVFINRRGNLLKMLLWEGDGFSIYYKQLERGTFEHPKDATNGISYEQLLLILRGINSRKIEKRKRYRLGETG